MKDVTFYAAGRRVRPDVTSTGSRAAVFVDETYNQTAKPLKWTYTGKILEA
jgi:hypothetical protein